MLLLSAAHANTSFKALLDASEAFISDTSLYNHMAHSFLNFNKLLWKYKFIIMKLSFSMKTLYHKNLEPYGI